MYEQSEYLNHQIPFTNKKNQLGIVLHQLDILIIHVWLCQKKGQFVSVTTHC